jgi:hypothetical protein
MEGMIVYSSDGERMGKVIRCGSTAFEIEKGFFFPKDYLVSYKNVSKVDGHRVALSATKEELRQQWERADLIGDRGGVAGQAAPIGYTTAAEVKRAGVEALQREAHEKRMAAQSSAPSDTFRDVVPAQTQFQHEHHEETTEQPISHRDFREREAGIYAGGEPQEPLNVGTISDTMEVDEVTTSEDLSKPRINKDEDYRI